MIIATIIHGLKTIRDMGGRFAIITATFPPVLKDFMEKSGLIEGKDYQFKDFSGSEYSVNQVVRHKIQIQKSEINVNEILEQGQNKRYWSSVIRFPKLRKFTEKCRKNR